MKFIEIKLFRRNIYREVARTTAYTGVKSEATSTLPDGEAKADYFDRLATVDEDNPLLCEYLTEAATTAIESLRSFIADANVSGETLLFTLQVSDSFSDSLSSVAQTNLNAFLTASVSARWFRLTCRDKATEWEAEAEKRLNSLVATLCHRPAPRRKK